MELEALPPAQRARRLQPVANGLRDTIRLGVHGTYDKDGLRRAVAALLHGGCQVLVGQQLVAILVRDFSDPAELIELRNRVAGAAFAERLRRHANCMVIRIHHQSRAGTQNTDLALDPAR